MRGLPVLDFPSIFSISISQYYDHRIYRIVMGSGSKSWVRVGFGYHFSGSGFYQVITIELPALGFFVFCYYECFVCRVLGRVRDIIFGLLSGLSKNPSGFRVFGFLKFC